jgi:hypothetical protein
MTIMSRRKGNLCIIFRRYTLLRTNEHWKRTFCCCNQGCQMAYFETKNPDLGKFWKVLQWKVLVYYMSIWCRYCMAIWYILWPLGGFYGCLLHFPPFWYVVPGKIWQPWLQWSVVGKVSIMKLKYFGSVCRNGFSTTAKKTSWSVISSNAVISRCKTWVISRAWGA